MPSGDTASDPETSGALIQVTSVRVRGLDGDGGRYVSRCPNCSAELSNEYCSACGQKRIRPEELSARHFFHELADGVAEFRLKLKTVRSLRALLTPGRLTTEYLAGRRRPYLSPIEVYFICAAIYFFAAPLAGFNLTSLIDEDRSGNLVRLVSARMTERGLDRALFSERFDLRLQSVYTISLGAGVIASALMLQVLFRRKALPFGVHLIFGLHYVSFLYLVTMATGTSRRLGLSGEVASALACCLITLYLILALKRFYPESTASILLKTGVLLLLTFVVNYFVSLGAIRLTLVLV